MLHFTELSTTVGWKPGRWQAVPLGPRVVVVGKNTAGKSRLITALSLLVSGKAPGEVFGKESEVALAGDLAMLYPTEDTETWGRTNDGRRLQPTKSGTPWVHPVRHIAGSLRKPSIADTFLGQFIIDPKADVAALIPAFYADEAKANTSRPKIPTTVSELLAALSSAGEHIRALNQTVKQAEDGLANNNAIADVSNDQISAAAALVPGVGGGGGGGRIPGVVHYYKMRGYYVAGAVFETWVAIGSPSSTPPSGHTLQHVQVVGSF